MNTIGIRLDGAGGLTAIVREIDDVDDAFAFIVDTFVEALRVDGYAYCTEFKILERAQREIREAVEG